MTAEAEHTADFIERVDRLFDVMNSNSMKHKKQIEKTSVFEIFRQFPIT
jgi:hypothetical protein